MSEPYLTLNEEEKYMRDLRLDYLCNTFERISEQLDLLHAILNPTPAEMEVQYV